MSARTIRTRGSRRCRTRSSGLRSGPSTTNWPAASRAWRSQRTTFSLGSNPTSPLVGRSARSAGWGRRVRVGKLDPAMEVLKITPRGYCHGVVDAFRIAKRVREETEGPVHMLGMLVHNTHATDDLQQQGIALVDQPDRLRGLEHLIGRVKARYPQAEVHNEICRATQERQEAAVEAAKLVDLVIVVGSPRSSNSLRLVEVVKKLGGKPAYLVDRMEDLNTEWFKGAKKVGVTSGASTPTQLTRRVIEHIEAMEPPI